MKLGNKLYISKDIKNENGILLSLSYRGYSLNTSLNDIENSDTGTSVKKYLHVIKDTGEIEFPEKFFEGIPDGSLFYLQINRLNFKVFDLEGNIHKIAAGSSFGINLALER